MKIFVVATRTEEFDVVVDDEHTVATATILEHSSAVESFHLKDSVEINDKDNYGCSNFNKWF